MDNKISTSAWAKEKGISKPKVDGIMIERGCIMRCGEFDSIFNEFRQVEEVMSLPETV